MSVDISMLGMPELERKFRKMILKDQKAVTRSALRKSSTRNKKKVVANIKLLGLIDTGTMYNAFRSAKNVSQSNHRQIIRIGVPLPYRKDLNIDPDDKFYYPTALEYGGHSFIRTAVDNGKDSEIRQIGNDIGKGIEKKMR